MAKIDLTDPKWVDMVFAGKNKEYGAYQLRKGTSSRNITSILILLAAAAIVGGLLVWKVQADKAEAERIAMMEQMELSKLQEQAKEDKKEEKIEKPKIEQVKEIPEVRETQKFTAPEIKKDELVKEENQMKQMDELDKNVAVGTKDQEGTGEGRAEGRGTAEDFRRGGAAAVVPRRQWRPHAVAWPEHSLSRSGRGERYPRSCGGVVRGGARWFYQQRTGGARC